MYNIINIIMNNIININQYKLHGNQPLHGWMFKCYHCDEITSNSFILQNTNFEIYMCKTCFRKNKIDEMNKNETKIFCFINKELHKKYLNYFDYCSDIANKCIV